MKTKIALLLLIFSSFLAQADSKLLRLATTTSTDNSGLLNELLPAFTADTGFKVQVIAVGTGKALRLGKDGDVDVVLVHAPGAEAAFVASGYGVQRFPVMFNDFVIVGPKADSAELSTATSVQQAFKKIKQSQSLFLSRGDNSGTHKKEQLIWKSSGIEASGSWYREVGQGMGRVLQMANELDAYTLTDRGTWLSYQDKIQLQINFEGGSILHNPYGIIAVNPTRYPDINNKGANALIEWITAKNKGQNLIARFKLHDRLLFKPMAN